LGDINFVTVTIGLMGVGTQLAGYTFDAAVSSYGMYNSPHSGGASVTVVGLNFGSMLDLSQTASLSAGVCATSSWSSTTSVVCTSGPLRADVAFAAVTVGGVIGTQHQAYTFDAPMSTQGLSNSPDSGGASLTLIGVNYGAYDHSMTVSLSGGMCVTSSWSTTSSVFCLSGVLILDTPVVHLTLGEIAGTKVRWSQLPPQQC
jgi:hypothetical protein